MFACYKCGKEFRYKCSKAKKKGLCSKRCDGILKRGGWPVDPTLRQKYYLKMKLNKDAARKKRTFQPATVIRRDGVETKRVKELLGPGFYLTQEWREKRYEAIKLYDRKCMVCFRTNVELHVDHIKPISKNPELALTLDNLQILCVDCNLGKRNYDSIDWRLQEVKESL